MKFFSRDSLVPEITGTIKNGAGWESAKQTVSDIDKAIRKLSSYDDTNKINENSKDSYVRLMKTIYNSQDLRAIVAKLSRGEELTQKEAVSLSDTMINSLNNPILKIVYEEDRKNILAEELIIKRDEIHSDIDNTIMLTEGLEYADRLAIAESLRIDIQEVIEKYEKQIKLEKKSMEVLMKKIEDEIEESANQCKLDNNYPMKRKK